jgi:putative FmdB family regulatory protein
MPLYDYDCAACGRRFEAIHGVYGDPPAACPLCGSGPVRKAIGAPAVHFKGSGWAKKERRAKPAAASSTAEGGEGSADSSSADTETSTKDTKDTKETKDSNSSSSKSGSTPPPSSTANPD